ncbi:MAG: FkbM family methyltransferase [Clostridia bacterium]|nr:FkbM family methyltransferase [Clostridia bacterium]
MKVLQLPHLSYGDVWHLLQKETRPIVIYGMGNGADKLLARLDFYGIEYADFFASDGFVRGHTFHGKRVLSFGEICEKYKDFVILLSFASTRREVLDLLYGMSERYPFLMPDLPVAGEQTFDSAFYEAHISDFEAVFEMWADEESAALYSSVLSYKLSADIAYLRNNHQEKSAQYELFSCKDIRCAIDIGAYRGDTLSEMATYFPSLEYAFAIEPDAKTFKKLEALAKAFHFDVCPIQAAAWSKEGETVFHRSGNRNSSLVGASYEHADEKVRLVAIDSLCTEKRIDYIKYDVEGAEREALLGSLETIRRDRPVLSVSLYHRSEDLYDLPLLLRENCKDYSFYLRRTECLPAWEISLIAVPNEKKAVG